MRKTVRIIAWITGIWAALLVIAQVALSPAVLTRILNKVTAEYIDGEISFGKAYVSMFRRFPNISITLEDFAITYPADRFDAAEKEGARGHLMWHGCGEEADTLASFEKFSASISLHSLLSGTIRIPNADLVSPRVFAHSYHNGSANWDIFVTSPDEEPEDSTESFTLPKIIIGKVHLDKHPHIIYTDSKDTLFAMIDLKQMHFNGKINSRRATRSRIGMHLDSMFVAGRIARDTIALGLDRLHIHENDRMMSLSAQAKTFLATRSFGRLQIPIDISSEFAFTRKSTVPGIDISDFKAEIASVPVAGHAELRFMQDGLGTEGEFGIYGCKIGDVLKRFGRNIMPETENIKTDAEVTLSVKCSGKYIYENGALPQFEATLRIPESQTSYKGIDAPLGLRLDAKADNLSNGTITFIAEDFSFRTDGLELKASATVRDVTGLDPAISLDGHFNAELAELAGILPDTLGIDAEGRIDAVLKGNTRASHLDIYNFSQAELTGEVMSEGIKISCPKDTIHLELGKTDIKLGPEELTSRRDSTKKFRLIALTGDVSSLNLNYKDALKALGSNLYASARTSTGEDGKIDTTSVRRLSGRLKADSFSLTDGDGTNISLKTTSNSFHMMPKKGHSKIPVMTMSSINKRIMLKNDVNRVILTDASLKAKAAMNTVERRQRARAFRDSLAKVYPDVPKDSLFAHMISQRKAAPMPEWLKEEDFRKQDIDISLDASLAKYFREWDLNCDLDVRTGILMTPYFPLRNILRGFEANITNDRVSIDSLKVVSGESSIEAKGSLSGLKRMLLGRGLLNFNLDISSDGMDANQLLTAYQAGSRFSPEDIEGLGEMSDADFLKTVTAEDTTTVSEITSLIVVPANLKADISLDAKNIKYSDLLISRLTADMIMKERCLQITNTTATSNMGEISFDGFYSTKSKKDLKTGFDFQFKDITAEKVISLMPAVDTIMPILKSFKGNLNCEMAATADLDTNMNIIMPSINGVMRIGGEDLSISDNEMFRMLARKLMFKNKKEGNIEKMTVEGMIKDNTIEVFPFVMKMDRYTLAMSGIQNMDMSFRYHVSVLKSPFLIRLGIDLSGPDFDNMKFKIGKAKYKTTNVPVFTAVIDQTKINLTKSIKGIFEKGVDAAVKENNKQGMIADFKKKINYINAVDQKLEALSEEEQKQMEADQAAAEAQDTTENKTSIEENTQQQ